MQVSEEMIRIKAYELWEANGRPQGSDKENWFTAQALLQKNASKSTANSPHSPPIGLKQLSPG